MDKHNLEVYIKMDLLRYGEDTSIKKLISTLIKKSAFRFIYVFRKCQYHINRNKIRFIIYKFFLIRYKSKYGYQIPIDVRIGKGMLIDHLGSVIINKDVIIGDLITINSSVTIGQTNRGLKKGSPTIGNKVWIGANAVIVGKIVIGNNVLIAPNSYVNTDVPDNSVVIGNPAKIIHKENATEGYI